MTTKFELLVEILEGKFDSQIVRDGVSETHASSVLNEVNAPIPQDLISLLTVANGEVSKLDDSYQTPQYGLFYDYEFLSVEKIAREYAFSLEVTKELSGVSYPSYPSGTIKQDIYFDAQWLPFAKNNASYIAIDMSPSTSGVTGQIINYGEDDFSRFQIAQSMEVFISMVYDHYAKAELHSVFCKTRFGQNSDYVHFYDHLSQVHNFV